MYLLSCADGSYYTGIAVDVERRLEAHNRGRGARYTRGRGPVVLVAQSTGLTRPEALSAEYRIKQLAASKKADAVRAIPAILLR